MPEVSLLVHEHIGVEREFCGHVRRTLLALTVQQVNTVADGLEAVSVHRLKCGMLQSQALSPAESARLLDGLLGET
ncbi:hypothetical protein P8605_24490 [Streptomyces sp. T-3]|nr:hypothetical protein [Streptomyces sp. T-3]